MNARQTKKRLKKRIEKLQADNDLMQRIIADSPKMQELYDVYTKPLKNVTYSNIAFQEFKARRLIPVWMADIEGIVERTKQSVAIDLFESIREYISYEVDTECITPLASITASVFVGRK